MGDKAESGDILSARIDIDPYLFLDVFLDGSPASLVGFVVGDFPVKSKPDFQSIV
jgi:hypothetical protein